jgi:hypothetical protein
MLYGSGRSTSQRRRRHLAGAKRAIDSVSAGKRRAICRFDASDGVSIAPDSMPIAFEIVDTPHIASSAPKLATPDDTLTRPLYSTIVTTTLECHIACSIINECTRRHNVSYIGQTQYPAFTMLFLIM